jgi:hypothetical protein
MVNNWSCFGQGEQNKLIATDQEGYTYKLLLR